MLTGYGLCLQLIGLVIPAFQCAVGPNDVYILVNGKSSDSQAVADFYSDRRKVPSENIIVLDLPLSEDVSREQFNNELLHPLQAWFTGRISPGKVLLTTIGVPLRVRGTQPSAEEKNRMNSLRSEQQTLRKKITDLNEQIRKEKNDRSVPPARNSELSSLISRKAALETDAGKLTQKIQDLSHQQTTASVDSELSLLWCGEYDLRGFVPNPLYFQLLPHAGFLDSPVLMTCRLDGPDLSLVKRLIVDAMETEARGLSGRVYVDARGIKYDEADGGFRYGGYDESMREMARLLERDSGMQVTLDNKPALFPLNSCPDCAIYCGWYSLANYVDSFDFVQGAVAWHLASSECVSLRNRSTKQWCRSLLEDGAAATLGPVAEPYTLGFPKPAEFYGALVTGKFTLVECYWRSTMLSSWAMVVVGDPLYNPFAKMPRMSEDKIRPSPAGTRLELLPR
jgi:uncharacterized protein (TIGR03790 family)